MRPDATRPIVPPAPHDLDGDVRARAVVREAQRLGYAYPADAPKLVDLDRVSLGGEGRLVGARDVVEDLARRRPELFDRPDSPPAKLPDPGGPAADPIGGWGRGLMAAMVRSGRYARM